MWAPTEDGPMREFMAAFSQVNIQVPFNVKVTLVIPHEPFPGCTSVESILDLWSHPIFQPKWKNMVTGTEFLRQPTRCVSSGAIGPLHHLKSLVLVTLSTDGATVPAQIRDWRSSLFEQETGPAILIDCKEEEELVTHRTLAGLHLMGLIFWEGPRRSRGATREQGRVVFTGHFDRCKTSELEIRLHIRYMKQQGGLQGGLIGSRSLFNNRNAMIIEMGQPSAIEEAFQIMEEVVSIGKKLPSCLPTTQPELGKNSLRSRWDRTR